jgi:hypothetical protein
MPKINLNSADLDNLHTPRPGSVGLLEGRKAMGNLYDSRKWDMPQSRSSKPKTRMVTRAMNTRKLSVEAYDARHAGDEV